MTTPIKWTPVELVSRYVPHALLLCTDLQFSVSSAHGQTQVYIANETTCDFYANVILQTSTTCNSGSSAPNYCVTIPYGSAYTLTIPSGYSVRRIDVYDGTPCTNAWAHWSCFSGSWSVSAAYCGLFADQVWIQGNGSDSNRIYYL